MMSPVLDVAFVTAALGGRLRARAGRAPDSTRFTGAAIDSRAAQRGDLFVALPGERVDGHEYAPTAVRAGATGCLLTHPVEGTEDAVLFLVDDTLASLQDVGAAWRAALTGM
ncbi:MAG: Mur ligase domain-containing protein, partial [Chloroflexota bacterium]